MLLEPSPLRIILVAASVNISALSSTPKSCSFFISSIFLLALLVSFPKVLLASSIIIAIELIKNPAEPVAKSMVLESLFTFKISAIIFVTYGGVRTIPISLPSPKAYFKNSEYISPIISKCPAMASIDI